MGLGKGFSFARDLVVSWSAGEETPADEVSLVEIERKLPIR